MAVSESVRRLLHVLNLEEESRRRALESAQAELARLGTALRAAVEQEKDGRLLFASGVRGYELDERLAGQAEMHVGRQRREVLQQCIQQSMQVVEALRVAFLEKRVEKKQAETLVKAAEAKESLEESRRTERSLDSWYLMRPSSERSDLKHNMHESAVKVVTDECT
jgi:pyruvate dehydrogenase complex dehydrogenase (E1) component